ncbi:MAG TPA: family 1 glycosylhydrolase [Polyangiaceae bacterium]|nr:family 1 glycosylhydrolase [Polyangiaceae bacterium]
MAVTSVFVLPPGSAMAVFLRHATWVTALCLAACAGNEEMAGPADGSTPPADVAADRGSLVDISLDAARDATDAGTVDVATADREDVSVASDGDARTVPDGPIDADARASDVGESESATVDGRSTDGVGDAPGDGAPTGVRFPDMFVFGTAIAGFQADMGCPTIGRAACDDPNSDWYVFSTAPETVGDPNAHLSGQDPGVVGPGFWELYPDDIRRVQEELHHQAMRLSLEWSRIFPTPTDGIDGYDALKAIANPAAIARYHAIFAELKKRSIRPLVTLYHYALPTWIHDAKGCHVDYANCTPKGWVDQERAVREIAKYAAFCAREFGGEIDWWATVNEPLQNMVFGYLEPTAARSHPPAVLLQQKDAKIVFHALIDAHARMYDAVKQNDPVDADSDGTASWVGVVYPLVPIEPAGPLDTQGAKNLDYLWNRAYLNAVAIGHYDENLDGTTVLRPDLANRMDYVGVNWYGGLKVTGWPVSFLPDLSPLFTVNPLTMVETDNQPDKLAAFLQYVNKDLGRFVMITENGTGDPADDGSGPRCLVRNLKATADAMNAGADVRGYFYWTLMDNVEWNHGMDIRMGLYAVSKDDPLKLRVARKTVGVYDSIARSHVLSDALITQYGGP